MSLVPTSETFQLSVLVDLYTDSSNDWSAVIYTTERGYHTAVRKNPIYNKITKAFYKNVRGIKVFLPTYTTSTYIQIFFYIYKKYITLYFSDYPPLRSLRIWKLEDLRGCLPRLGITDL